MCVCEVLTKNSLIHIEDINRNRYDFNEHNEDFFDAYYDKGLIGKTMLRKSVYILKKNHKCIGYLWRTKEEGEQYYINSISIVEDECNEDNLIKLLSSFKRNNRAYLMCRNNGFNVRMLENIGFKRKSGTLKLECLLNREDNFIIPQDTEFRIFQRGKDEEIRCYIQNEVFKNETRKPLTVKDIIFDQCQDYYFPNGTVFIKVKGNYIGYGQIIIDKFVPLIVNVGILKEYRNRGYGEALIKYILSIAREFNFSKATIKVDWHNRNALNLYKKCGFRLVEEDYKMEILI